MRVRESGAYRREERSGGLVNSALRLRPDAPGSIASSGAVLIEIG